MKNVLLTLCSVLATVCTAQIVPNGNFEEWDTTVVNGHTVINPRNWVSYGEQLAQKSDPFRGVTQTVDAHSGNYAIKVENGPNALNGMVGLLASGNFVASNQDDGFPLTNYIDKVEGYYKYQPVGNDSARIIVVFYLDGSNIGGAYQVIKGAASTYTKFSLQLHYNDGAPQPDKAKVYVISSNLSNMEGRSVLYLDDLKMTYLNTGLSEVAKAKRLDVYPNPVEGELRFDALQEGKAVSYRIADVQGRSVEEGIPTDNLISTDELEQGVYMLQVTAEDGSLYQSKFVK